MSRSLFCGLCGRDPDTGEYFCVRSGKWVEKCPKHDGEDGAPWDAERIDLSETENEGEENE